MKLELKESNSPFWLIGLDKGKILLGSSNEVPCYYKSGKKQYELAKQVSKSSHQPDEVYLITGTVWDNMKSSWSSKECGSYVQNKGRLIWSKNEITSYMEKYEEGEKDMNLELKEDKYPKGVSRDPLPKDGVKVYTSVATPLESKECKFKPELKDVEECETLNEGSTKLLLSKGDRFENGDTTWEVMDQNSEYTLINALGLDGRPKTNRFAVVWGLQEDGSWNQGHYFSDINRAIEYFEKETIVPVEENKKVIEAVSPQAIMTAIMFTVDNWDKLKDIIETFRSLSNEAYEKALTAFKYLQDTGANIKDAAQEIGNIFVKNESISLNEDWSRGIILKAKFSLDEAENAHNNGTFYIADNDSIKNYIGGTSYKVYDNPDKIKQKSGYVNVYENEVEYVLTIFDEEIKQWLNGGITAIKKVIKTKNIDSLNQIINSFKQTLKELGINNYTTELKVVNNDDSLVQTLTESNITLSNKDLIKKYYNKLSDEIKNNYNVNLDNLNDFKEDDNDVEELATEIQDWLIDNNIDIKPANDGSSNWYLKESKIVEPVGNPQVASSFVNIDVDLDHMEVSDFIVRLAQAVRSEQLAILEYVALRSANGVTNADRSVIDKIIEEEKNHLAAITSLLYKQILENHSENVDQANKEFELPKFGMEIFDNTIEGKLQESLQTTINKLCETSLVMSDDFYVGDNETGQIFHGLSNALNVIQKLITTSGNEVLVYNNTLASQENESIKLTEETFNSIDDLIKELSTDTNYDEIAYHIHCYSKTNKAIALELMDMLFELERNKSPKECRDEIINHLEEENKQYKTEDTKITQNDKKYNVEVDVEYDSDVANQVFDNISREVAAYNDKNDFELTELGLKEGKFYFTINKQVTEKDVEDICKEIFDKATNYSYQINIK